ncbi:MAG: TetR family transcriptional regulator, partial [Nitrospinae bacterium]|nr:TetR family transcriptional regulator [Nitrospinota bacterium]
MNRRTAKESKESILEAAIRVFSEKGYSQTTIREVA